MQRSYAIVWVLMSSDWIGLWYVRWPYWVYWTPLRDKPLLMVHCNQVWYHRSVYGMTHRCVVPCSEAMPSYESWWAQIGLASEMSDGHIEYIGHHWEINLCSWSISIKYDIIEASMVWLIVVWLHTAKLCHRMSPDELRLDWPLICQMAILSIFDTIER